MSKCIASAKFLFIGQFEICTVGTGVLDGPKTFLTSMGKNVSLRRQTEQNHPIEV
jgi:hypothetical protein